MDDLAPILAILPPHWRDIALAAVGLAIAIRTAFYALVKLAHRIDMADGREDWAWVGRLGDCLAAVDRRCFSWLPVKAPFVRGDP